MLFGRAETFPIWGLLLAGAWWAGIWCAGAWAEPGNGYVPSWPAFHQPRETWRARHGQNLVRPQDRWPGRPAAEALSSCLSCHEAGTCLDCHRAQGGPDLRRAPLKPSPLNLRASPGLARGNWASCFSCHPREAAWPGSLKLPRDPGEYLPVGQDFPCPAFMVLGRQMSLMNLSLKRAEYLASPIQVRPLKAEASRWENLMASPLVLTRAEDIVLGMQNLERLAEQEISRPALAAGERRYLLILAGPFLGFGLLLAWRARLKAKRQPAKGAGTYTALSLIFLSLSLGGGAGLIWGPDAFFYPGPAGAERAGTAGGDLAEAGSARLLFLTELADSWIKTQPRQGEPVEALARIYQETKSLLLKEAPACFEGPPWPSALGPWALTAKSAAGVKYGRPLTSPGREQGAEIWDDQINWLFTLPDSALKRTASLIMVRALAEIWPRLSDTPPLALPAAPPEESPPGTRFGRPLRQSPAQQLMERLLANLTEPEELAMGLAAYGSGLARSGFEEEAARVFGRAYETALYIKDQPLKVSVFLELYQAWAAFDKAAGGKVLAETLAVAASREQAEESRNHWAAARSLAQVARVWSRTDLPGALTLALDLQGQHEAWLTARAAALAALGASLEPSALKQYHDFSLKPANRAYAPYLQAFDLKAGVYFSSWLAPTSVEAGKRLLNKAGPVDKMTSTVSEEQELLARAGGLALKAKNLINDGHPGEALEVWRQAWALAQVAGNYQHYLAAARLYRALGDAVADERPDWAALAYQKAFEITRQPD